MFNLLSNAVKFTPDAAESASRSASFPTRARRRPAATGGAPARASGVGARHGRRPAPKHHEKIFEAFYQVRGGTTDKTPGTGLGLALVRKWWNCTADACRRKARAKAKAVPSVSRFPFSRNCPGNRQETRKSDPLTAELRFALLPFSRAMLVVFSIETFCHIDHDPSVIGAENRMKSAFLDKLIERLDRLDPGSLQTQFLRLASEQGLLETIFNAMREGLIVLDHTGRSPTPTARRASCWGFLGSRGRAIPSRYLREIEWERLLRLDEQEWTRLVSREIEISYPEHRFLAFYLVPLAPETRQSGAVVILRDVTRDREHEARRRVRAAQRAELLAAGVAHEIGNPLNSLTIHLQLLDRELEPAAGESGALKELLDVSRRRSRGWTRSSPSS